MRISIERLQNALPNQQDPQGALNRFLDALSAPKVPAALKFRMARVTKQIQGEMETFEAAKRELVEKHGGIEKDGKVTFPTPEIEAQANADYQGLLKEEVEIRFDTFTEDSIEGLEVRVHDLLTLDWLFGGIEKPELKAVEQAA